MCEVPVSSLLFVLAAELTPGPSFHGRFWAGKLAAVGGEALAWVGCPATRVPPVCQDFVYG